MVSIIHPGNGPYRRIGQRLEQDHAEYADNQAKDNVCQRCSPHGETTAHRPQRGTGCRRSNALPDDHCAGLMKVQITQV